MCQAISKSSDMIQETI